MAAPLANPLIVSPDMLDRLASEAAATARRRLNLNLHASHAEPCQRFFNAMEPDSYLRPHRQLSIPRDKLLVGIRGQFALILFADDGTFSEVVPFAGGDRRRNVAVEVPAGRWNTVISLATGAVLLEVKEGPFDPDAPRELASWAPEEGAPEVGGYLAALRAQVLAMQGAVAS